MKKIIITVLLSCFITFNTNSKPSTAFNHLMDEPITLWDFGLRKIESQFDRREINDGEAFFSCSTQFDWDDDILTIACRAYRYKSRNPKDLTKKEALEMSQKVIDIVRIGLGYYYDKNNYSSYDEDRKSLSSLKGYYPIEEYFVHEGFVERNRPKDLGKQLENKIKITVGAKGKGLSFTVCESKLHKGHVMCRFSTHEETAKEFLNQVK
jgi:hypothetical protein